MATANVIRQRITLDGAKEVEDALKSIGAVGEAAWKKLQAAMGGSGGPTVPPIVNSLKNLQKEFQAAGKAFEEVGTKMRNVGAGFSLFLSAPLTLAGKDVIKTAADFESAMTTLQIATQSTGQEFDALREKARQIGKDTMFDPSQAAQAMTELAKTGVSTKDILNGAADAVVKLATANEADLAPSAKMLSDVMQQFKIKVGDIPAAVDKISGAINLSKLDFNDYQLAVSQAGQVVGSTGGNFDDFNAALTATSSAFASGSDAGTSFKTFMQNLIPQTDKASAQMLKFGLATQDSSGKIKSAFFTSSGQFKGFAAAADLLKSKLGGLSDAAKTEVFHDLFGTDSSRTALKLMDVGSKGLREITDQIKKYDASLAVTQRMKTFNGQLEQLNGSFQELKIAIGDSGVLEAATKFVKVLADLVEEASKANPVFLKWGFIVGGLAAAIGPVVGAIGLMLIGWGKVASTTGSLVGAFANVIAKGGALGTMFRGLAGAVKLLKNPWVELGILLIANWRNILDAAKQFYQGLFGDSSKVTQGWIKDWTTAAKEVVASIKSILSGNFNVGFNGLKAAGSDAIDGLKKLFSGGFGAIAKAGIASFVAIRVAGVLASQTIKLAWTKNLAANTLWGPIARGASILRFGELQALLGWPALFLAAIDVIATSWPAISKAAGEAKDVINTYWPEIRDAFDRFLGGRETWDHAWDEMVASAKRARDELSKDPEWKSLFDQIGTFIDGTKTDWTNLQQFFESNHLNLWENTKQEFAAIADGFRRLIEGIEEAWQGVVGFFGKIKDGDIKGAMGSLLSPDKDALNKLKSFYDDVTSTIQQQNKRVAEESQKVDGKVGIGAIDAMKNALEEGKPELVKDATQASDDMREAFLRSATLDRPLPLTDDVMHDMQRVVDDVNKKAAEINNAVKTIGTGPANSKTFSIPLTDGEKAAKIYGDALKDAGDKAKDLQTTINGLNGQSWKVQSEGAQQLKKDTEDTARVWDNTKNKWIEGADAIKSKMKEIGSGPTGTQKWSVPIEDLIGKTDEAGKHVVDLKKQVSDAPDASWKLKVDASSVDDIKTQFLKVVADARTSGNLSADGFIQAIQAKGPEFVKALDGLKLDWSQAMQVPPSLVSALDQFGVKLKDAGNGAVEFQTTLNTALGKDSREVLANLVADATGVGNRIKETFKGIPADVSLAIKGAIISLDDLKSLPDGFVEALDKVGLKFKDIGNGSVELVSKLTDSLGTAPPQAAQKGADASKGIFDRLWQELGIGSAQASENVAGDLKDIGKDANLSPLAAKMREAFAQVKTDATDTVQFIADAFSKMSVSAPAAPAGGNTGAAGGDAGATAPTAPGGGFSGLEQAGKGTFERLKAVASETVKAIADIFAGITIDWSVLLTGLQDILKQIVDALQNIGTEANGAATTVQSAADQMVTALNQVAQAANEAANAVSSVGNGSGTSNTDQSPQVGQDSPGFATGGYISGPGTGTSDSIRAWLSNGEYVIRANAVQKYGKGMLDALNLGRLNIPAFANGGLVSAPSFKIGLPAFSAGGLVSGLSSMMASMMPVPVSMPRMAAVSGGGGSSGLVPANIHINGHTVPVMAQPSVLQDLARVVQHKRITTGGKKPDWSR